MQRKLIPGGIFLLFLFFAILTCIHPDTTTTDTSFTEDIVYTEETIATEVTISTEDTTSPDTISSPENIFCTSIIDGDTFRLLNGETVRLIGIDAPELSQPGGTESRQYLTHLILDKGITLDRGYEDRDKYNRLLRFVYIGNVCVNEEMIRQGYAEARYLSPDDPIREYYIQLEIEAEIAGAGLWSDYIFQPRSQLNWDYDYLAVIDWSDADKFYGLCVIVEGIIVNTHNSGIVCFLNFSKNYDNFSAVIFASDFPEFSMPPEFLYSGRTVQIIGIVLEYNGSPEIIVKTPDQIRILD